MAPLYNQATATLLFPYHKPLPDLLIPGTSAPPQSTLSKADACKVRGATDASGVAR